MPCDPRQPLADGAPPAPSSPAHSTGRPDGGARFEPDSDTAPPAGLPRMPDLDSPPIRSALAGLDQVDLQVLLQQRCLFFQRRPNSSKDLSAQRSRWLFGQLMSRGPRMPPLRRGPGHCGCSCPACCSTAPPAPTASQSQSGARGFGLPSRVGAAPSECHPLHPSRRPTACFASRAKPPRGACSQAGQPGRALRSQRSRCRRPLGPLPLPRPGDPPSRKPALLEFQPEVPVTLSAHTLLANLRRARKGAAAGPSGHTSELRRLVLDDEASGLAFVQAATDLAQAQVPPGPHRGAAEAKWPCQEGRAAGGRLGGASPAWRVWLATG